MVMLKKKKILLVALAVLVCVAGYLNITYDEKSPSGLEEYVNTVTKIDSETEKALGEAKMASANVESADEIFAKCRLERDETRSENIDLLNATINNANATDDAKLQAEELLINISDSIEKEVNIENIVRLKGFDDALAFISGDSVTVTVKGEMLTQPQISQIHDAVNEYIDTKNVKIVEVK